MLRPLGTLAAAMPADVMARLVAAEAKADQAKADALAADGRAEAARVEAAKAEATGQNARQMVLNRDVKIAEAESTAATAKATADAIDVKRAEYEAALLASVNDRATIHSQLNTIASQVAGNTAAIAALQAAVAALQALKVRVGFGTANLPASLGAGAATVVTVNLTPDLGATTYAIGTSLSGGTSLLGQLVLDGEVAGTRTAKSVQMRVRNAGLTGLANLSTAVVHVVAAREA